jgi:hypothetical protein
MMPVSVRVGPFAAFGTYSRQKPDFVRKARGEMLIKRVWVSPQYNATHIISIPGNWLIGGDLAVLMTAKRHFLLDAQFEPDVSGDPRRGRRGCDRRPIDIVSETPFPLNRNRDSISLL